MCHFELDLPVRTAAGDTFRELRIDPCPHADAKAADDAHHPFYPRPPSLLFPLDGSSSSSNSTDATPKSEPSDTSLPSSNASSFVEPIPHADPLFLSPDVYGRRQFGPVSDDPLPVDDEFVVEINHHRAEPQVHCQSCIDRGIECAPSESGVGCGACVVLGVPNCLFTDPAYFLHNLTDYRDDYLAKEVIRLRKAVTSRRFPASSVQTRYDESVDWLYRGVQGAIHRFTVLRSTRSVSRRGYYSIILASNDIRSLNNLLSFALAHHLHPLIVQLLANRVLTLTNSNLASGAAILS